MTSKFIESNETSEAFANSDAAFHFQIEQQTNQREIQENKTDIEKNKKGIQEGEQGILANQQRIEVLKVR